MGAINSWYQPDLFVFSKSGVMLISLIKSRLSHPSIRSSYGWYDLSHVNIAMGRYNTVVGMRDSLENSLDYSSQMPEFPGDVSLTLEGRQLKTKITLET